MLVAFTGQKESGKSTAAKLLADYGFKRVSFAAKLRDYVSYAFGLPLDKLADNEYKEKHSLRFIITPEQVDLLVFRAQADRKITPEQRATLHKNLVGRFVETPRKLLQLVGTEGFRNSVHPSYWISMVASELVAYDNVVVDDARFINEVMLIQAFGGSIVNIERPSLKPDENSTHASENIKALPFDIKISNTDLNMFRQNIVALVNSGAKE